MYAELCARCLRECKQNNNTEIISCHFFTEQLSLKMKAKKVKKKSRKSKEDIGKNE